MLATSPDLLISFFDSARARSCRQRSTIPSGPCYSTVSQHAVTLADRAFKTISLPVGFGAWFLPPSRSGLCQQPTKNWSTTAIVAETRSDCSPARVMESIGFADRIRREYHRTRPPALLSPLWLKTTSVFRRRPLLLEYIADGNFTG
jgi:hypothetical protein